MLKAVDRALSRWHLRHRDKSADAGRLPDPSRPPGSESLAQIRHIVLLMMENHSFDNYLGTLGRGEGLRPESGGGWGPPNESTSGAKVYPFHFPSTVQHKAVPTQSWHASHVQFGDGYNDGFVRSVEQTAPGTDIEVAMGYWTEEDLPFYADLAKTFALADHWYSSLLGPTFPNRRFLIAGTANGLIDDSLPGMFDYPRSGTIFDLLDRYGIHWTNYHHVANWKVIMSRGLGKSGVRGWRALRVALARFVPRAVATGLADLQFTANVYPRGIWHCLRHLRPIDRFFDDARDGRLPPVSIVDPDFRNCSEENPQDIHIGEGFSAAVINAVMRGKAWRETLLIWFYDEHGGYFDHVPPPPAVEPDSILPHDLLQEGGPLRWLALHLGWGRKLRSEDSGAGRYDRYGFRVPAVMVSPYAKTGYVSSTVYDHTSALKLIERKWNLPPLTARDAAANDPLDMLDLAVPAFAEPPRLAPPRVPWGHPVSGLRVSVGGAGCLIVSGGVVGRKKRWSELSPRTRRLIVVGATFEGLLKIMALIDIKRRPASGIRGSKLKWALAVLFVNSAGALPIAYFLYGRRGRPPSS